MRTRISDDIKVAMKSGEKVRTGTLRLINAAIQSAEIESKKTLDYAGIIAVMTKMVKQRRDSIAQFTSGNRPDLAAIEQTEIEIIEAYLPKQMDEAAASAAIAAAIKDMGAVGAKDMGKVMTVLKTKYAGKMDFQKASAAVKAALS